MEYKVNYIYNGNTLDVLKELPDKSIDMCITSPPYWNMRDYNENGQLGLEYTTGEFIDNLYNIFHELQEKAEEVCDLICNDILKEIYE